MRKSGVPPFLTPLRRRDTLGATGALLCTVRDGERVLLFASADTDSAIARFDGEEVILGRVDEREADMRLQATFGAGGTAIEVKSYGDDGLPRCVGIVLSEPLPRQKVAVLITRELIEWRFNATWECRS